MIATPTRRRSFAEADPFAPVGLRRGAFTLWPALEIATGFDSNPARVPDGRGSSLLIAAPEMKLRSDWPRHALDAYLYGTYSTYFQAFVPSLDRPAFVGNVNGRIDVSSSSRFNVDSRLIVGTDNPGSPNLQVGLARLPIFTTVGSTLGYTQRFNRLEFTAAGSADRTVYEPSKLIDGTTASNDDRNYNQYGIRLRGSYELTPGVKPFIEAGIDRRVHDVAVDRTGAERNSDGLTVKAGTTFEITRKLVGSVAAGYVNRRYQDSLLPELRGPAVDAALIWTATPLTTLTATALSTVQETVLAGVSGTWTQNFGLQIDHSFRRWLLGTVKLGFGIDDYVGSERIDHRYSASAMLTYKLTRTVQFKGEFRHDWLRSTASGVNYDASIVLVGVRLQR